MKTAEAEKVGILLVDDRPDNLTVLQAVLSHPEYELVFAHSGLEAIEEASRREFAAILLDIQMPGMDGLAAAREIRKGGGPSRDAPIIFVTAIFGDDFYVNLGYEAGAVDYLFKPFNPAILRSKVAVFAKLHRNSKKLIQQSEELRARELAEIRYQGLQREHQLQYRYIDLVNSIDNCVIWSADPESLEFSFVSPHVQPLTGFGPSEVTDARSFWTAQAPADDRVAFERAMEAARQGEAVELDHRFITRAGVPLWFHTRIRKRRSADGDREELSGISVNVTSLKEAEARITASEEGARFLAEAGAHLASSLDYGGTLSKIAALLVPRMATWCAVHTVEAGIVETVAVAHRDSSRAASVREFYQDRLREESGDARGARRVIMSGRPEFSGDLDRVLEAGPSGDLEWVSMLRSLGVRSYLSVPMVIRDSILGSITIASGDRVFGRKDLSLLEELARRAAFAVENARLYKKAEGTIEAKDEFLSIASHELRTPLTPLKIQIQNLARIAREGRFASMTQETLLKVLTKSDHQLDRLNKLIEDLLSVSRINLGRLKIERTQTDLSDLIRDVADQFRGPLTDARCALSLDIDESIVGHWDAFRMEQVLINLLTNAIKYGAGKPIRISARASADRVHLAVEDHGIGIDPNDQERVFGLFERASSAKNYGGLGLGLYIVRNIVEQHGGHIWATGKLGEGSRFIIDLPRFRNLGLLEGFVPGRGTASAEESPFH